MLMMTDNYPKAYVEVLEILKYVSAKDLAKIPPDFIQMLKRKKDISYIFKIDKTKSFDNQIILKETREIFAIIYKNYWALPEIKSVIDKKLYFDLK